MPKLIHDKIRPWGNMIVVEGEIDPSTRQRVYGLYANDDDAKKDCAVAIVQAHHLTERQRGHANANAKVLTTN